MALNLTLAHPDGDLIIPGSPRPAILGHGAWVTQLTLPDTTWRREYAPASEFIAGQLLLSAVREAAAITALISIKTPSSADLQDELVHLEAVLSQFSYDVTTETETRAQTWRGEPADITYGEYSVGTDRMSAVQIVISIPANPTA